jgi:hypothetical protein
MNSKVLTIPRSKVGPGAYWSGAKFAFSESAHDRPRPHTAGTRAALFAWRDDLRLLLVAIIIVELLALVVLYASQRRRVCFVQYHAQDSINQL